MRMPVLETERLILRRWRNEDRAPFFAINSNAEVSYWLGGDVTRASCDAGIDRAEASFDEKGFGRFAIERKEDGRLIGCAGMMTVWPDYPFTGLEIGWRLSRSAWGRGYASEAARAALIDAFDRCGLAEIVAYTAGSNLRSMAVMERIGMLKDPSRDFNHPQLPRDHPLSRHVFYFARAKK